MLPIRVLAGWFGARCAENSAVEGKTLGSYAVLSPRVRVTRITRINDRAALTSEAEAHGRCWENCGENLTFGGTEVGKEGVSLCVRALRPAWGTCSLAGPQATDLCCCLAESVA